MTGTSIKQMGISAFLSKLVDAYADAEERDEVWRQQIIELLPKLIK